MDIGDMRNVYYSRDNIFLEEHISVKDPIHLFKEWFQNVVNDDRTLEPNAGCLATSVKDGMPSNRFILLKSFDHDGFKMFTHCNGRKAIELQENPKAALSFYWEHLIRSVRIEGNIEKLPEKEADDYFGTRSYHSQIATHIVAQLTQTSPIANREVYTNLELELKNKYSEGNVPRPKQYGGYLLRPTAIEFWQGQRDRLSDRIRFRHLAEGEEVDGILLKQGENGWVYERLA